MARSKTAAAPVTIAPGAPGAPGATVIDDSSQATSRWSRLCTWCYWWKPLDGHHCAAWPPGGTLAIPDVVWEDRPSAQHHVVPFDGSERTDAAGQPIVFRPHPDARAIPPRLKAAYEAAHKAGKT